MKNEKVENLIKKEKERLDASKKQMRDTHLISLGLTDENKTERIYQDRYSNSAIREHETGKYYTLKHHALEVTDDEYEEICKYYSPTQPEKEITKPKTTLNTSTEVTSNTGAEVTLNTIAVIVLVCGIIGTLICLFTITFSGGHYKDEFSLIGFIVSIGILLTSLTTWSVLKVFCEIAMNVRQSNNNKAK